MAGHIPFAKVDAWLRAPRSIWIATTRPDGRAHVVPVWFHWDGRNVYFNAAKGSQKHVNLQHRAWAVAHLGDGDDTVILEGAAEVVGEPAELRRVDEAYRRKYVDPHSGARAGYPESSSAIPYRIDIRRIMVWEYGVVATRTDFLPDSKGGWAQMTPSRI